MAHTIHTTDDNLRIKFFCRSFDLRLYRLSKMFYQELGYPCVRLTDQSADGYFYTILADTSCDIAINVDEDCFITNLQTVLDLVEYMVANGYANCGCPDGGGNAPRHANPLVTNPFFNILDLRLIRTKFSKQAVKNFRYDDHKPSLIAAYPQERLETAYTFDRPQIIEPYYQFFLWMAANFSTLYLPPSRHADGWTTILRDPQGCPLCAHSWLARYYSVPSFIARRLQKNVGKQKSRIDALIREVANQRGITIPREKAGETLWYAADKALRWIIKVPQRIAAWPAKYRRYHP